MQVSCDRKIGHTGQLVQVHKFMFRRNDKPNAPRWTDPSFQDRSRSLTSGSSYRVNEPSQISSIGVKYPGTRSSNMRDSWGRIISYTGPS